MRKILSSLILLIAALWLILLMACAQRAFGQTGALLPAVPPAFTNNSGLPAANAKLCTLAAGTTSTWASVYSDSALMNALPNPITLNALGIPQTGGGQSTAVYLSPTGAGGGSNYKLILYAPGTGNFCNGNKVGTVIWTRDNIYDYGQGLLGDNNTWTGTNAFSQIKLGTGSKTTPSIVGSSFTTTGISWASGNSSNLVMSVDSGANYVDVNSYGFGVGTSPAAQLHLSNPLAVPFAWTTAGIAIRIDPVTYTDQASSGTVGGNYVSVFDKPTLAASHATTYTTSATMYIDGAPLAGSNVTLTNPYALYVNSGAINFPGITFTSTGIINGPSGLAGGPTYSFVADNHTGAYLASTGIYAIATNGTQAVQWDASQNALFAGRVISQQSWGFTINTFSTPADNATCVAGSFAVDASFIYVCTASGTVKRATLATY